jgi:uncharacterized protein
MRKSFLLIFCGGLLMAAANYRTEMAQWQRDRAARLVSDSGWTTVAGLYWLKPGLNKFPGLAAPVEFLLEKQNVKVRYQGSWRTLRPDTSGADDVLVHAALSLTVIERDGRLGVRVRDKNSPYRRQFKGLRYFPVNTAYRIEGRWLPYAQPKKVAVDTVIDGVKDRYEALGQAEFTLHGKKLRLEPVVDGDELFYIFRDTTTGKSTYGAGRFLYGPLARDGRVVIDFNKAYNPPCAFTPYATCPLPPPQNRLPVAVEAGERAYHLE